MGTSNNERSGPHPGRRRGRLAHDPRPTNRAGRENARTSDEEAEDQSIDSRCARRDETRPSLTPERLADLLERSPAGTPGHRQCEAHTGQASRIAKISRLEAGYSVAPHIAWQLSHGRQATLGQLAIPLRPERVLAVREVESVNNGATLPAAISGRLGP
jgi:hypothetical protein